MRARAAQIHVHTRKERSNSVKKAATLARASFASASQQNLAALSCSKPQLELVVRVSFVSRFDLHGFRSNLDVCAHGGRGRERGTVGVQR